jgi:ornithine--oxo-acid transaminase
LGRILQDSRSVTPIRDSRRDPAVGYDAGITMTITINSLIDLESRLGAHNYKPLDVVLVRGEGVWVWDADGKRYLDCLSAYSALNQGHCHPRILAAMVEQAGRLTLTSRAFRNDQLALLYEDLAKLTRSHKILPMNSGAEAVESAVKAVRKWGYEVKGVPADRAEIIVCSNNFHGRTLGIVGFSTDPDARGGFGPFAPGFRVVPFGDFDALAGAINDNTVAFLVEPIQGEAGVIIPPAGYFARVRTLCTQRTVMLILDEIQTGLGRTGKLLAEEHEGIEADVTLIGKALSGGYYPVSAVLSNNEVLGVLQPGQHGSTFGGNPLACAVARMALKVLIEEGMIENAARQGAHFMARLEAIRSDVVHEVRGRGLMLAVELTKEAGGARRYCELLRDRGLLAQDTHEHTIRIAPPLPITRDVVDWACDIFDQVLGTAAAAATRASR